MEKQDYLKRQIEMLSQALKNIIAKVLNISIDNSVDNYNLEINQIFKSNLGIDTKDLLEKEVVYLLKQTNNPLLTKDNIELLADILLNLSDRNNDKENKKKLLNKSLEIYKYLNREDTIYSFDRQNKILEIKKKIQLLA